MEGLFENPIWIVVIVLGIICLLVANKNKKTQQNGGNAANAGATGSNAAPSAPPQIGEVDKVEEECGWYRTQKDNQVVIKRTDLQQRIVDEYFIVRNIKTTTCDSSLKKLADKLAIAAKVLLIGGAILAVIGLTSSNKKLLTVGIVAIAGWLICKIVSKQKMKAFEKSIKATKAPKKLMSDAEFESLVQKKIEEMNIEQLGLERLGLDPDQVKEIRPIVLQDKVVADHSFRVYGEDDHSLHSSTQHVTYLYFTDEQLFVYKIQFDMCCNMQDEWAHEFFYTDICDIQSHTYKNILKFDKFEYEYSSVAFAIISSNSEIGFEIDGDNENVGSIQAMKQKIRERKAQR